jgi:hypothetical protein
MKKLLLLFLFIPFFAVSQIPGVKIEGPIDTKFGFKISKGDKITVGTGTDPNGDFKFIYMPPNGFSNQQQNLQKSLSGTKTTMKGFKQLTNKSIGTKTWGIVNFGGLNMCVEVDQAIESGELIIDDHPVIKSIINNTSSVADELLKLKTLLDSGLITKEEFETQKKKILQQ